MCECVSALFGKGDIRARMKERERGTLPLGEREAVSAIPPLLLFCGAKRGREARRGRNVELGVKRRVGEGGVKRGTGQL